MGSAAIADGVTHLEPKFAEYACVFKGRKQLNYSPCVFNACYQEEEKSDEEYQDNETFTIMEIEKDPWTQQVLACNVRGHLLELSRAGCIGDCVAGLEELGIESRPATSLTGASPPQPDPAKW